MVLRYHWNIILGALGVLVIGCGGKGEMVLSPCGGPAAGASFFKSLTPDSPPEYLALHRPSGFRPEPPLRAGGPLTPYPSTDGVPWVSPLGNFSKAFFWGTAYAQTSPVTVSGTLRYEDRAYDMNGFTGARTPRPIRYARVEAIRDSDGALLASGSSDGMGDYFLSFSLESSEQFMIRVYSATAASSSYALEVRNNISAKSLYALASNAYAAASVPSSVDLLATVDGQTAGIFNILDVLVDGTDLVISQGETPPLLTVYWESGTEVGTCYNSSLDAIFLLGGGANGNGDTDEYDDDIVLHEYGHFLARHFSRDDSPGGTHTLTDSSQDTRLSWSEGWGHFLSSAVRRDAGQVDTVGSDPPDNGATFFEIEGALPIGVYSSNELAVAAVLWDIFDDPSDMTLTGSTPELFDSLALDFSPVWDVVDNSLPNTSPVNLGVFWKGWYTGGHNAQSQMEQIFLNRQIRFLADAFEPDSSPDPNRKMTGTERHTFYDPSLSEFGQDVDVLAFDAEGGTEYTISTSALSDGADTRLELLDTDGMTVLALNDNRNGLQYTFECGLDCPSNDQTTLSSQIRFTPLVTGIFFVRVTRSPSAPASAGRYGVYEVSVTSN